MKKLMLAMSGGVDSSVALILLREKYEVIGVTLHLFDNETCGIKDKKTCCSEADVSDAAAVAAKFGIPHYVYNFKDKFKADVITRFNSVYLSGGTPNPCIDCNNYIKFGAMLERAVSLGFDCFATGHYAQTVYDETTNRYLLKKSQCSKDQSYVLYGLTQEQLARTVFPLGELDKTEVRTIAEQNKLTNSNKPDSQDICFVPGGDYAGFIENYTGIKQTVGKFITTDGKELGTHKGIYRYTAGQRKGLGISHTEPLYVIDKNTSDNTVIVGHENELYSRVLVAENLNWISVSAPSDGMRVKAKTRYKQKEQPCTVYVLPDGRVRAEFDEPQRAITSGQRVVFYDDDIVVGGGIISSSSSLKKPLAAPFSPIL